MCKPPRHPQIVSSALHPWPLCTQPRVMGIPKQSLVPSQHPQTVPHHSPTSSHLTTCESRPWYPKTAPGTPRGHKPGLGVSTPGKPSSHGAVVPHAWGSPPRGVPSPSQGAAGRPLGFPGCPLGARGLWLGLRVTGRCGVSLRVPGGATGTLCVTRDRVSAVSRDGEVPLLYPAESCQSLPVGREGHLGGGKGTPQGHWELSL